MMSGIGRVLEAGVLNVPVPREATPEWFDGRGAVGTEKRGVARN